MEITPKPLSASQNKHLTSLWNCHSRELVESNSDIENVDVSNHAYNFCTRLCWFFQCLLDSCVPRTQYLHDSNNSSLQAYYAFRLRPGRHVISLHHGHFLSELNSYETQSQNIPEEFIKVTSFGAYLHHVPEEALRAIGCSMVLAKITSEPEKYINRSQIIVRFHHLQPSVPMMDVKTGLVGKLVTIKGHIVKARPKRLAAVSADFHCLKCRNSIPHKFEKARYSVPTKCNTPMCRSRSFSLLRSSVRYIDAQEIRLQEAQEENTTAAGRTPRQLEVEFTHDLVDQCRPGDIVQIAAIVAAVNTAAGQRRAKESTTFKLYLEGHSVATMSESSNNRRKTTVAYTPKQLSNITQLCHADHRYFSLQERRAFPFDLLVRSVCPAIIGHNEVKAGLLLCLLGGTPPSAAEKGNTIRSNAHILVVGDPGMGKSQMLLAATQLAARSVYVGGNTSSTTGLTVSLTKEERGETGIEAGALVLADQGVCAIDEMDKMQKNHQDGLLEAMEQQQVSIAKAGVVASLPARCSVIAAANPKHGSYNMSKTVAENLSMAKPILSRFDLVFILRDRANKELDRMVSGNIMNLYRTTKSAHVAQGQQEVPNQPSGGKDRLPLQERLNWVNGLQKQPLSADLVRDYIAYAREFCAPKLTAEAAAVLKDYYMKLRYPSEGQGNTVPITTRQLEALIRLSQARAKACLREYVLKEDALDVVDLMGLSVEQVHSDEGGNLDKMRGGAGGSSNRKMKKAFAKEVRRLVGVGAECTLEDLRRVAVSVNCGLSDFPELIDDLRNMGLLIKKSNGNYQVLA